MTIRHRRRGAASRGAAALIDRTTGTNIGDMTSDGGLAAAFDGITSQDNTSSARDTSAANNVSYIGKTMAAPTAIESVTVYGSNNQGYTQGSAGPSVTITLYGKQGSAPASGTDGTSLGTTGAFTDDQTSNPKTINSSDVNTYWDHVWVYYSTNQSAQNICAELQMTGWQ